MLMDFILIVCCQRSFPLEPGPVCINSCSFNHNGQLLLAGGVDGSIRLFGKWDFCDFFNQTKFLWYTAKPPVFLDIKFHRFLNHHIYVGN